MLHSEVNLRISSKAQLTAALKARAVQKSKTNINPPPPEKRTNVIKIILKEKLFLNMKQINMSYFCLPNEGHCKLKPT